MKMHGNVWVAARMPDGVRGPLLSWNPMVGLTMDAARQVAQELNERSDDDPTSGTWRVAVTDPRHIDVTRFRPGRSFDMFQFAEPTKAMWRVGEVPA